MVGCALILKLLTTFPNTGPASRHLSAGMEAPQMYTVPLRAPAASATWSPAGVVNSYLRGCITERAGGVDEPHGGEGVYAV